MRIPKCSCIDWNKPGLGLVRAKGSPQSTICVTVDGGNCGPSPFRGIGHIRLGPCKGRLTFLSSK